MDNAHATGAPTMAKYLTCAETAKLLRKALKAAFPGTKFSVRSDTYSMGASIRVRWTDGPMWAEVDAVARRFAGATFDGMRDLKEYHTSVIDTDNGPEEVRFGADFVFTNRDHSPEAMDAALVAERAYWGAGEVGRVVTWDDGTARIADDVMVPNAGMRYISQLVRERLEGMRVPTTPVPAAAPAPEFANEALRAMGGV